MLDKQFSKKLFKKTQEIAIAFANETITHMNKKAHYSLKKT